METGQAQRTAESSEEDLRLRLFRESVTPLPGIAREQAAFLIGRQFVGRSQTYAMNFPNAKDMTLKLSDGLSVGRCLYAYLADFVRMIDLAVLAAHQRQGLGTTTVRLLQSYAQAASLPLRLRVLKGNAAVRLYERLGFRCIGCDDLAFEMEWLA